MPVFFPFHCANPPPLQFCSVVLVGEKKMAAVSPISENGCEDCIIASVCALRMRNYIIINVYEQLYNTQCECVTI